MRNQVRKLSLSEVAELAVIAFFVLAWVLPVRAVELFEKHFVP